MMAIVRRRATSAASRASKPLGAAEVGDARVGGDAGPGEHDDALGRRHPAAHPLDERRVERAHRATLEMSLDVSRAASLDADMETIETA
jgi:hypothetical protein